MEEQERPVLQLSTDLQDQPGVAMEGLTGSEQHETSGEQKDTPGMKAAGSLVETAQPGDAIQGEANSLPLPLVCLSGG